jgi:hypothetical protein
MEGRRPTSRIVICGHPGDTIETIAQLIKAAAPSTTINIFPKLSMREVQGDQAICITTRADDVFAAKKIVAAAEQENAAVCFVLVIYDPRTLLLRRDSSVGVFEYGFDHALHCGDNGVRTFSGLGIDYTQAVVQSTLKRYPRAVVVRHEDLRTSPDRVQTTIAAVTGLTFEKSFSQLLLETPIDEHPFDQSALSPIEGRRLVRQCRLSNDLLKTLDRWKYCEDAQYWWQSLAKQFPKGTDDTPGTIVGFYTTDSRYEAEARRLKRSIEKLDLPARLLPVPQVPNWLQAVRLKPYLLLEQRRAIRGPLLYVDVDAVIHSDPWPYLKGYEGDIAVAGHRSQAIISGTLLLNDTPAAVALLEAWIAAQERNTLAWDQHCLEEVVKRLADHPTFCIDYLPPGLCRVFDRRYNPPVDAVIEHLQASRERYADSVEPAEIAVMTSRRKRLAELAAKDGYEPQQSSMVPQVFAELSLAYREARTSALAASHASDVRRLSDPRNLKSDGSRRADIAAGLIGAAGTVIDLGCGALHRETALRTGISHLSADIVSRDSRMLACDLNTGSVPDVDADVATLLGVLEYCHDVPAVFGLLRRWPRLIVSYNASDLDSGRDRLSCGWMSGLTTAEFVRAAHDSGFGLGVIVPHGLYERIFEFERIE